ncbi:MAG: hypothetical protein OXC62_04315 [Aestuariivita sp.]|nr:hypothetical protein [Aestuariivita sp.]
MIRFVVLPGQSDDLLAVPALLDAFSYENFFAKIKEFRAIAPHYDKTVSSFAVGIYLVAGVIATR